MFHLRLKYGAQRLCDLNCSTDLPKTQTVPRLRLSGNANVVSMSPAKKIAGKTLINSQPVVNSAFTCTNHTCE